MVNDPGLEFSLRVADVADAASVATAYSETRLAAVPAMPAPIHSAKEDREFFTRLLAGSADVWVAEVGNAGVVGFMAIDDDWLHSLYVRPEWNARGIGSALLDLAKVSRPGGFALWVFESNLPAHRFYSNRGLVPVRRTDGSANEERAPDVQMLWPGLDPIPVLRDAIDGLDRELARLLELRSGLTAEVQAYKSSESGRLAPRDPVREAEIVARMEPLAPRLGRRRLEVIMHAVIAESLDAVESETNQDATP